MFNTALSLREWTVTAITDRDSLAWLTMSYIERQKYLLFNLYFLPFSLYLLPFSAQFTCFNTHLILKLSFNKWFMTYSILFLIFIQYIINTHLLQFEPLLLPFSLYLFSFSTQFTTNLILALTHILKCIYYHLIHDHYIFITIFNI